MEAPFLKSLKAVAVVAVLLPAMIVGQVLWQNSWDPSALAAFGLHDDSNLALVQEVLDREVVARDGLGHDGRFFFLQALDPLITAPADYVDGLDRPTYRAQRVAYPALAGGLGLMSPEGALWGMVLVNFLALVAGTVLAGRLAIRFGLSPWLGLAFLINPGVLSDLLIGGGGILALTLLLAAVNLLEDGEFWPAIAALTGAVLSREVMAISLLGIAALHWHRRREAALLLGVPISVAAAWWAYVHWRLPSTPETAQDLTLIPFEDLAATLAAWGRPLDAVLGVITIAAASYVAFGVFKAPSLLVWATAPWILLLPFLTEAVAGDYFNLTRAVSPIFVGFAFLLASDLKGRFVVNSDP